MQITKDRQYLQHLERLGEGKINWETWDRLVEQTKKEIADLPPVTIKTYNKCYAYDGNGEQVNQWESYSKCTNYFKGCADSTVRIYLQKQQIIDGLLLSCERLSKDVAFALYRDRLETGKVYQKGATKFTMPVYTYDSTGRMIGAYSSKAGWAIATKTYCNKFKGNDIIYQNRLVSKHYYDQDTAREIYNNTTPVTTTHHQGRKVYTYRSDGTLVATDNSTYSHFYRIGYNNFTPDSLRKAIVRGLVNHYGHLVSFDALSQPQAAKTYLQTITEQSRHRK